MVNVILLGWRLGDNVHVCTHEVKNCQISDIQMMLPLVKKLLSAESQELHIVQDLRNHI